MASELVGSKRGDNSGGGMNYTELSALEQEILKIRRSNYPKFIKEQRERELRANAALQSQEGVTQDPETGLFTTSDGRVYENLEEARKGNEEARRMAELQDTEDKTERELGELESLIKRSGFAQKQMVERVGARQQGQLMGQLQRSILGTGGEAQTLGALVPQIQEQGERGLLDRLTGIEAQTAQQLQQVPQLAIGQANKMAGLGQTQQQIQDQMSRAMMSQETSRAQIQANLDNEPEWWEPILGAAGAAAGTALTTAVLASDIRIKENISQVGSLDNGLPVYLFNYKGNKTPQIGLMAQDVEKVNNEAVVEIDGIKHVYYGKAVK